MSGINRNSRGLRKAAGTAIAAFSIAVAGATVQVAPAVAQEARNLVTFGDSYLSNPLPAEVVGSRVRLEAEKAGIPLDNPVTAPLNQFTPHGCGQSPTNAPRQMGQMKGLEVRDYSCPGALAYAPNGQSMTLHGEINNALADGALDANTSNVVIQFGFNDSYSWLAQKVVQDGLPNTYENLGARYAEQKVLWDNAMNSAIDRIKAAAPNARITIADYPTISEADTAEQCLLHVELLPGDTGIPAFWIRDAEVNIHNWSAELAARRAGDNVVFANLRDATAGSGECAPDDSRMIAGVIDTTARTGYNLPVHMTHWGVNHAANVIAATF